jgi:hypothetical protein
MSTLEDLDDLEREQKEDKGDGDKEKKSDQNGDAEMKDAEPEEKEEDPIDEEIYNLSTQDILTRKRLLENDSRIMKSEFQRLSHEKATMGEKIKDNLDKIENNRYTYLATAITLHANMLPDNYHILLVMLLSFSTWTQQQNPRKKVPTSTWMLRELASLLSSRPRPGKPFFFPSSGLLIQNS